MKKCKACGKTYDSDYAFCPMCGSDLTDGPNVCSNCGKEYDSDYKFCPSCGKENKVNTKPKKTVLVAIIAIGFFLAVLMSSIFLLPKQNDDDAPVASDASDASDSLFEEYVQELYDNADDYKQGFPVYLAGIDTVHLKYAVADFDGDKSDELLIYSADATDINYYDEFTLSENAVGFAYLTLYELKDGKVVKSHTSNCNDIHEFPEKLTYLDRGIAFFEDSKNLHILNLNGKNFENSEFYDGSCRQINEYNDPDNELRDEWNVLKENCSEVSATFERFDQLTAKNKDKKAEDEKESVIDKVPGLENFCGDWADTDNSSTTFHITIGDDNGKLRIDINSGTFVFDAEDISVDDDNMICKNGYGFAPSGNRWNDCILRACYDTTDINKRTFEFVYGGSYRLDLGRSGYSKYSKLTQTDYGKYIGLYREYLGDGSYYNELQITEIDNNDIYYSLFFYRLASGEGKAVGTGPETAKLYETEGSLSISGEMKFDGDTITLIMDEQQNYYLNDTPLSEFLGLKHTFVREDSE